MNLTKKLMIGILIIATMALMSSEIPYEVKVASSHMVEIMENPTSFIDHSDELNYTNKVMFIQLVEHAALTYPSSERDKEHRLDVLRKCFYISTNTPYLNVPIVVTPHQFGLSIKSEVKFNSEFSTNTTEFGSSHSNISYRLNQNPTDFNRPKDSDIMLIEEDNIKKRSPYFGKEPMKYPGQY